ncbi:MAG: hypothetical protein ABH883_07680, partial [Candidatus Omnitrophota bacterium]
MKYFKAIFIGILILFSLFCGMNSYAGDFNLTEPEEITLIVDEKPYTFKFYRYDPPYMYKTLWESKEEADISTPEGTERAINSATWRDTQWYLSLFDENARALEIKEDKEFGGKILVEDLKGKPFPTDITKRNSYFLWYYKIEMEINGKQYATIFKHSIRNGEFNPYLNVSEYVKQGDVWLSTEVISNHPIRSLLSTSSYEKFMELCKKGKVYDEMPEPIPLEFTAKLEKDSYEIQEGRLLEPIKLSVELKNVSWDKRDMQILNILEPLGLVVHLEDWERDKEDKEIFWGIPGWELRQEYVPDKKDIYALKYGETLTAEYMLSGEKASTRVSVNKDENGKTVSWRSESGFLPGTYEIPVKYVVYAG